MPSDSQSGFAAARDTGSSEEGPRLKVIALGLAVLLVIAGGYKLLAGRGEKLARLAASEARITLAIDDGGSLAEVNRDGNPEVYYRVVLSDVPLVGRLSLRCEWVDPDGRIARRNRYRTRFIYKNAWPTHCRQRFGGADRVGRWEVRMLMNDRVLSTSSFVLK